MKTISKIFKRILTALLAIIVLGILTFTIAGLLPVKNSTSGIDYSCYITMKDDTKLAVRYAFPKSIQQGEKLPAILETTRYGTRYERSFILRALTNLHIAKELPSTIYEGFLKANYVLVRVDSRGSAASFGTRKMEFSKEEIDDMGQIIDWIANQPWSNGKVGAYGMSYSGNTAELALVSNHPALRASAPLYPDFDVMTHSAAPGGILNEFLIRNWNDANVLIDTNKTKNLFSNGIAPVDEDKNGKLLKEAVQGHKSLDTYAAYKNVTYIDDTLADNYTSISISPYNYKEQIEKSGVPLYVRVGWMDAGTVNGSIERFLTYKNNQTLVIGPWNHTGSRFYDPLLKNNVPGKQLVETQAAEIISFFDKYLKDDKMSQTASANEIKYYTMGEGKWKTTKTWPVQGFENKTFYFAANGKLDEVKPVETTEADTYKVDFTATTGNTTRWRTNLGAGAVFYPDRASEDKKLLTYTSEPLKTDIEITGLPVVTLNLSSTSSDGAFFTYLEDVAPDGKVTYITEGQLRAVHRKTTDEDLGRVVLGPRHSYMRKDGQSLKPGENAELKIGMYATSVLIKKGHKIRIAIAGHDTSNFIRIPAAGDTTIKVQRNSILSSYVELPMKIRNN